MLLDDLVRLHVPIIVFCNDGVAFAKFSGLGSLRLLAVDFSGRYIVLSSGVQIKRQVGGASAIPALRIHLLLRHTYYFQKFEF